MKTLVLATSLLLPTCLLANGAETVSPKKQTSTVVAARRGTTPPMFGQMAVGESVMMGMIPAETFNLYLNMRQIDGFQPETLKGTLSLEVRIQNEFMPMEDSWYQVGTVDFSDLKNEPKVKQVLRKIECPADAVEFRVRFLGSNLRSFYNPRVEVMGVMVY